MNERDAPYRVLIILVVFLLPAVALQSCYIFPGKILPNSTTGFTIYQRPVADKSLSLAMNGIYISETGHGSFFLYKNGKVKIHLPFFDSVPQKFPRSPQYVIQNVRKELYYNAKEWWGEFEIRQDSITIQWFNYNWEDFYKRQVSEVAGKIVNDSTIEIYSEYWIRGKQSFFQGVCPLHFYALDEKPDNTRPWFIKKRWYQEKLHGSRR